MTKPATTPPLTFLVASPHLRGGYFGDTVVLLLEHTTEGAVGLVINDPLNTSITELLPEASDAEGQAMLGGPVQPQVGWCLYQRPVADTELADTDLAHTATNTTAASAKIAEIGSEIQLTDGLVATTHLETFAQVRRSGQRYRLLLGYAGWDAGQLENETREGAWLWLETEDAGLFWDTPASERWTRALSMLGVDPSTIAAGGAQA